MKLLNIIMIALFGMLTHQLNAQTVYTSFSYSTGLPVGETNDYISKYSWRGIGFEANWFFNDNMSLGFNTAWNVFYEEITGEFTEDTKTLSGTQQRTLNVYPILMNYRIHLNDQYESRPYFGLGVGTYRTNRDTEMGIFYSQNKEWKFGIAPEIGIVIPMGSSACFNPSLRYNLAFKTKDSSSMDISYLSVNIGFGWLD